MYIVQKNIKYIKIYLKNLTSLINKLDKSFNKLKNINDFYSFFSYQYKCIIVFFDKILTKYSPEITNKELLVLLQNQTSQNNIFYNHLHSQQKTIKQTNINKNYIYENNVYTSTMIIKLNKSLNTNNINLNLLSVIIPTIEALYQTTTCYQKFNTDSAIKIFIKSYIMHTQKNIIKLKNFFFGYQF